MTPTTFSFAHLFDDKTVAAQLWCVGECFTTPLHGVGYEIGPVGVEQGASEGFLGLRQTVRMPWRERLALLSNAPAQLVFEQQCQVHWQEQADGQLQVRVQLFALLQEPHLHDPLGWLSVPSPAGRRESPPLVWSVRLATAQTVLASDEEVAAWLRVLMGDWEQNAAPSHLMVLEALRAADTRLGPSDAPRMAASDFGEVVLPTLMHCPVINAIVTNMQQSVAGELAKESLPWLTVVKEAPVCQQSLTHALVCWQWHGGLGAPELAGGIRFTVNLYWSVERQYLECVLRLERPSLAGWHTVSQARSYPLTVSQVTRGCKERYREWLERMAQDAPAWSERLLQRKTLGVVKKLVSAKVENTPHELSAWAGEFSEQAWLYRLTRQVDATLRKELSASGFAPHIAVGGRFPHGMGAQVGLSKVVGWTVHLTVAPIAGHRDVDIYFRIVLRPQKAGQAELRVDLQAGFGAGHGARKELLLKVIDWVEESPAISPDSWERRTAAMNKALFEEFTSEPADTIVPLIRECARKLAEELVP